MIKIEWANINLSLNKLSKIPSTLFGLTYGFIVIFSGDSDNILGDFDFEFLFKTKVKIIKDMLIIDNPINIGVINLVFLFCVISFSINFISDIFNLY